MRPYWGVLVYAVPLLAQLQPSFHADVNLVRVPCVVTDASGAPVRGLRCEDFVVTEDGVPQKLEYLWQESDLPLTIGLIADVSGSEYQFIDQHRQTLMQFLSRILSPNDRAFLVSVERQQRLVTDETNSIERLRAGTQDVDNLESEVLGEPCTGRRRTRACHLPGCRQIPVPAEEPCGGTALWNGVFFSAKLKLRPEPGRKAMLLLTDGWDTGSDHAVKDAIEACQAADTVVYSIRYAVRKPSPWNALDPIARFLAKGKGELERITGETGGLAFEGESEKLPEIFDRIEADLRSEYVLGYTLSAARRGRGYRRIKIKVRGRGLKVRAREGYYYQ